MFRSISKLITLLINVKRFKHTNIIYNIILISLNVLKVKFT